jgi:hypothetical protein
MNENLMIENDRYKRNNTLLMNTNVELLEIYDKTFANINFDNIQNVSSCNIDASLLLNSLILSLKQLLEKMKLQYGGKKLKRTGNMKRTRREKRNLYSNKKHIKHKKQFKKGNTTRNKTKKKYKLKGGLRMNLITSLLLSILAILTFTQYAASVQPEYDLDVLNRLTQVEKIKDIFENKYGTCAINTALFLGSINLETYEKVTEEIIERRHGLTYSEISHYLNSSLKTLWEWNLLSIPKARNISTRYLRGSLDRNHYNQEITDYINILKNKMRELREKKKEYEEQGIITAMMYPSYGVHHAVVIWLSSDDTLVIIDPQEFVVHGGIVLYSDNLTKYPKFNTKSIEEYFSQNLDYSSDKSTALLMDYHVKREENLLELSEDNEKVKKVIEKMNLLENVEM